MLASWLLRLLETVVSLCNDTVEGRCLTRRLHLPAARVQRNVDFIVRGRR